jgi:hypothetical protein
LSTVWLDRDDFFLASAVGVGIPTSNKFCPDYLFAPVSGPNGHANFINTILLELPLYTTCGQGIWLLRFIIEDRFYYPRHQRRMFDLKGKPWSRYITVRQEGITKTVPARTVTTQCVKVYPYNIVELQLGLTYHSACATFEIGYDFWGRSAERLNLIQPSCEKTQPLLTDFGLSGTGITSASGSTIATQAANDEQFVHLRETDLDLCGNGSTEATTNRVYMLASYTFQGQCTTALVNLGGFFESSSANKALPLWGIWSSVTITF